MSSKSANNNILKILDIDIKTICDFIMNNNQHAMKFLKKLPWMDKLSGRNFRRELFEYNQGELINDLINAGEIGLRDAIRESGLLLSSHASHLTPKSMNTIIGNILSDINIELKVTHDVDVKDLLDMWGINENQVQAYCVSNLLDVVDMLKSSNSNKEFREYLVGKLNNISTIEKIIMSIQTDYIILSSKQMQSLVDTLTNISPNRDLVYAIQNSTLIQQKYGTSLNPSKTSRADKSEESSLSSSGYSELGSFTDSSSEEDSSKKKPI
jgi:hypothetical protein